MNLGFIKKALNKLRLSRATLKILVVFKVNILYHTNKKNAKH